MLQATSNSNAAVNGWREVAVRWMQRLAETAVAIDPKERKTLIGSAREELGAAMGSQFLREQLAAAERAAELLVTHNERTQESIDQIAGELSGIIRSVTKLSGSEDAHSESLAALRRILENSSSETNLHSVRDQLMAATKTLEFRLETQRKEQEELIGDLRKRVAVLETIVDVPLVKLRPAPIAVMPPGAGGMDPQTGLGDRETAERAIWQAQQQAQEQAHEQTHADGHVYAAVFGIPNLLYWKKKYGQNAANLILLAVGQQLGEGIHQPMDLYRWSEAGLLAVVRRAGDFESVSKEVARHVTVSAGWYFEFQKSLIVVTKIIGKALTLEGRSYQDVGAEIDGFAADSVEG